jgi:DNA invertase Pin-like site-specific DNA recombinase
MFACGYFSDLGEPGSLAAQNQDFLDYCQEQGYEVHATFFDRSGDRSGFLRLVDYLRPRGAASESPKEFAVTVIPRAASLGPTNEVAAASYYALRDSGARVIVLDLDPFDNDEWPASNVSEESIGSRVRAAMRKRALKGEVLGRPPYGYSPGRYRRLQPVAEEAAVVRYMFKLYLREGLGVRLIARRLNEEGYRTRQNKLWTMVSVRDILRNRVYLGNYNRLGVRVPGSHPRLVSEDDFKRVQERMAQRRSSPSARTAGDFLLAGLLACGECGNHMIGVTRRQSWRRKGDGGRHTVIYRYYQCQSRTNQGICRYHTRRAEQLEASLREALLGNGSGPDIVRHHRAGDELGVQRSAGADLEQLAKRLKALDARIARVLQNQPRRKQDAALLMKLAGDRIDLEIRRADIEREAARLLTAEERRTARQESLWGLLQRWDNTSFAEAQEILKESVERIDVYDDRLEVRLY